MNIIASTVAALIISTTTPAATWNQTMPRHWYESLAQCETGNNTKHSTRSYVGAFGFYRRTWDLFADTPNRKAKTLTFNQQARIMDRAFWYGHTKNGHKQYPVGPWGHGCFKKSPKAQRAVCTHAKQQVRRWCRQ
jgi:hypothetical protein